MEESPRTEAPSRVFELYIDSLEAERDAADELLAVHLGFFGEDVIKTMERLKENPRLAHTLVLQLSSLMQELDADAGGVDALSQELGSARRWALLLPGGDPQPVEPPKD